MPSPSILSRKGFWRPTNRVSGGVFGLNVSGTALAANELDLIIVTSEGKEFLCMRENFSARDRLFSVEQAKVKKPTKKSTRKARLEIEYV